MSDNIRELGKLRKEIYKCITANIDTERVIITEEQLNHIANHHPEAYNNVLKELKTQLQIRIILLRIKVRKIQDWL